MILKNSKNTKVNHIPISKITQTSLYTLLQIPKNDAFSFINDEKRFDGDEIHSQR